MKRLNLLGSWKRIGIQAGLLAGVGLAFMGNAEKPAVAEDMDCPNEGQCTFKKPVFMIILDYSTSMNNTFGDPMDNVTRWQAEKGVVQTLMQADMNFVSKNMLIGLMRFGHDPDPNNDGTTIPNDGSGIVDGQAVDVLWFDDNDNYKPCNGQEIVDSLDGTPAPIDGNLVGIGTWTNGALQRSKALMEQDYAAHPENAPNMDNRAYLQMVLTDGEWTNPQGQGQSAQHDPANTAADMFNNGVGNPAINVPTYVVYFGDLGGNAEMFANELAAAGGTMQAITADDQIALLQAVQAVIQDIKDSVILPNCVGGLPRIMVLADASSSMLNAGGGTMPAAKGESGWDQTRFALAGDPDNINQSLFEQDILDENMMPTGNKVEDLVYLGLAVFGHNSPAPGEQDVLVQYGPCHQDNFYWAMSPEISDPDCPDYDYSILQMFPQTPMNAIITGDSCDSPWEGSPINWNFPAIVNNMPGPGDDPDGPGFDDDTQAHMPKCDSPGGNNNICSGSGTFTHLGLQEIKNNQVAYHTQAVMDMQANDTTAYINLLITDGQYNGYSTDAQVQAELEEMFNNGIPTYVIGLGDGVNSPQAQTQLNNMAGWGGTNMAYDADNQAELELALKTIIESVDFDPCCQFNDCSKTPEPTTNFDDTDGGGCTEDADCAMGEFCDKPMDSPIGSCEPLGDCIEDADCEDNPDTPTPEICQDSTCVPGPCTDDAQCDQDSLPPEVCDVDQGICVPGPCTDDAQCPDGLICENSECITPSCPDVPCEGNLVCDEDSGQCIEPNCGDDPTICADGEECIDNVCTPMGDDDDDDDDSTTTGDSAGNTSAGPTTADDDDDDDDDDTDSGTDTGSAGEDDEGCGCAVEEDDKTRGLLGTFLTLGLVGFIRRRRRSA